MKITPLNDNVLIERVANESTSKGGIIIPPTAQDKQTVAHVLAVGPGTTDNPMTVEPGQTVLIGKYSGTEVEIDGAKLVIVKVGDILGIIS